MNLSGKLEMIKKYQVRIRVLKNTIMGIKTSVDETTEKRISKWEDSSKEKKY